MKRLAAFGSLWLTLVPGCTKAQAPAPSQNQTASQVPPAAAPAYFDNAGRDDVLGGGARMIPPHAARPVAGSGEPRIQAHEPEGLHPDAGSERAGASGKLLKWDRTADLKNVTVPTLVIGARYDTMDPEHMEWMSHEFPKGRYLYCPNGSHLAMYDDQQTYFTGLISFIKDADAGKM